MSLAHDMRFVSFVLVIICSWVLVLVSCENTETANNETKKSIVEGTGYAHAPNRTVPAPSPPWQSKRKPPPSLVSVYLWPRSQWDPARRVYEPARIVASRAIRICQEMNADRTECIQERDAWSTAVCRETPWSNFLDEAHAKHRVVSAHRYALFHTYNNFTYEEIPTEFGWKEIGEHEIRSERDLPAPSTDIHEMDWQLLLWARRLASRIQQKSPSVLRWDRGHFWLIPHQRWNMGERALATGRGCDTKIIQVDPALLDDRPLYLPL